MRNVTYAINISVDGYCDHTLANPDDDLMDFFTGLMQQSDLIVWGRKTYELMVPYWPNVAKSHSGTRADNAFAETVTAIDKIVVSRTLDGAEGAAKILHGNLEEEIARLKQQPGKSISLGGTTLFSQLMKAGLIDEFYFVVHPIIVGGGKQLFESTLLPEKLDLTLAGVQRFKSGVIALHYLK